MSNQPNLRKFAACNQPKILRMLRTIILGVLLSAFIVLPAQNSQTKRFDDAIQGNIVIIGNNILNRETNKEKANIPYDDTSDKAKVSEQQQIEYIDVDNNANTFSSSSATINIYSDRGFSLVYAGLYWTATYPYAKGEKSKNDKFEIIDKTRNSPVNVLLKIPSKQEYIPIKGNMIFDGYYTFNSAIHDGASPYVAYADVTEIIKQQQSIQGEYFVANVLAATGFIKGGTSAGWALVMIYKENGVSLKRITTYDGFLAGATTLNFDDFYSKDSSQARILGATLGGSLNIVGDRMIGHIPKNNLTFYLTDNVRSRENFFNSSITKNNDYVLNRNPKSKNTLGFDIFDIDFSSYQPIPKGVDELNLRIIPGADKIYSFFNALVIDIENPEPTNIITTDIEKPEPTNPPLEEINIEEEIKKAGLGENDVRNMEINNAEKGYYNVVGVYYNSASVIKLIDTLTKKGYKSASYLFDDKTYYHYVYTTQSTSFDQALKFREELKKDPTTKDSWILAINK